MLDDRNWIETSMDPFPESGRGFEMGDAITEGGWSGGGGGTELGNCTFCGGDGLKDNGQICNKCGGDGWL
jgi:hypothetical protein